jgi:hypothetical protein
VAAAKNFPAISLIEAHALLTRPGSPFELEERDIRGVRMPGMEERSADNARSISFSSRARQQNIRRLP